MSKIILTLDDIPIANPVYHNQQEGLKILHLILRTIINRDKKAILFLIGSRMNNKYSELIKDFTNRLDTPIEFGNHTFSHSNLENISINEFFEDILRNEQVLNRLNKKPTRWFRPPFLNLGSKSKRTQLFNFLKRKGLQINLPDIFIEDWIYDVMYLDSFYKGENGEKLHSIKKKMLSAIYDEIENKMNNCKKSELVLLLHANYLNSIILDNIIMRFNSEIV